MADRFKEVKVYLDSFIDYEKVSHFPYKTSLKLARPKALLKAIGNPQKNLRVFHIAGTKGKGSTAHFCSHILASLGHRVGLFTSPHFFDIRERIKIITKPRQKIKEDLISKKENLIDIVGGLRPYLEGFREYPKLGKLSFFEVYTAIALKYFERTGVDFCVLETGLGGRLDATNLVDPLVSIITHIGFDHMDKLGDTLAKIAREKSGIIKKGTAVVSSAQKAQALSVIANKAKRNKLPFYVYGRDFEARNIRIRKDHTFFDFGFDKFKLKDLKVNLKGQHQIENASCALAAVSLFGNMDLMEKKIDPANDLKVCGFKGRFELIQEAPKIIVDVAHNGSSFKALANNLKVYFPSKKVILIFGCSKDKNPNDMLKEINYSHLILTRADHKRSFDVFDLLSACYDKKAHLAKDIKQAIREAKRLYKKDSLIVISGSFFLVSDAKKALSRKLQVFS